MSEVVVERLRKMANQIETGEVTIQEAKQAPVTKTTSYQGRTLTENAVVGHRLEVEVRNVYNSNSEGGDTDE